MFIPYIKKQQIIKGHEAKNSPLVPLEGTTVRIISGITTFIIILERESIVWLVKNPTLWAIKPIIRVVEKKPT
jgi:hypothetical protein